jgi:hypothetical protein
MSVRVNVNFVSPMIYIHANLSYIVKWYVRESNSTHFAYQAKSHDRCAHTIWSLARQVHRTTGASRDRCRHSATASSP